MMFYDQSCCEALALAERLADGCSLLAKGTCRCVEAVGRSCASTSHAQDGLALRTMMR